MSMGGVSLKKGSQALLIDQRMEPSWNASVSIPFKLHQIAPRTRSKSGECAAYQKAAVRQSKDSVDAPTACPRLNVESRIEGTVGV